MDKTQHTPGPWKFFEVEGAIGVTTVSENDCDVAACDGFSSFRSADEERANAHLIAAAPDLFEALYRLKSEAEADGMDKRAGWDCWVSLANAAIAKAEGSTNA